MAFFKSLFGGSTPPETPEAKPVAKPASPELDSLWAQTISEAQKQKPLLAQLPQQGIAWNEEEQRRVVSEVLPRWRNEFFQALEVAQLDPARLPAESPLFLDLAVLYSMVAERKPTRLMEVGCGHSTRVIRAAFKKHNLPGELIAIDPNPTIDVTEYTDAFLQDAVQSLPPSDFETLQPNEMLHLDLTHRVAPGGDVEHLYQRILPVLKPGVVVGIQGVPFPLDYSQDEKRKGFGENSLLHLFLLGNQRLRLIYCGGWCALNEAEALRAYGESDSVTSRSIWFEVI